jgi:endonuclease/exonuclease/phosphatase (EEP) superfamily protein YafD
MALTPTTRTDEPRGSVFAQLANRLAAVVAMLMTFLTLVAFAARWSSLCELAVHWRVQYATVTSMACLILLLTGRRRLAVLAGAVALFNALCVAPLYLPQPPKHNVGAPIHIVSANVHSSNRDVSKFLDYIREERPGLILALEVDDWWKQQLDALSNDYPYFLARARNDNFGMMLLSQYPIRSRRVVFLDNSHVPTIVAEVDCGAWTLNVIGTHPLPPVGSRAHFRNQHLRALGEMASRSSRPLVVVGDLNVTSWSPYFQDVLQRSGLYDSRRGFGVQPTWPNRPWVLRIPIDHALFSDDLVVVRRHVGPDIGSDHLPISVTFGKTN